MKLVTSKKNSNNENEAIVYMTRDRHQCRRISKKFMKN